MAERFLREQLRPRGLRPPHLRDLLRRRPDGGRRLRGGVDRRAPGLGRCVFLYDDNQITIDGPTDLSFSQEDVEARFRAYGWHTLTVEDGNDLDAIEAALRAGMAEEARPTLIRVRTVIGFGLAARRHARTRTARRSARRCAQTKEALGWDPDAQFLVPDGVLRALARRGRARRRGAGRVGGARRGVAAANPELAAEWRDAWARQAAAGPGATRCRSSTRRALRSRPGRPRARSCRRSAPTCRRWSAAPPTSCTRPSRSSRATRRLTPDHAGRNVAWGVREHGMGAAVNGLALHGGIVKPYGSTFFVFTDYMRRPIRLSALMKLDAVWVFTPRLGRGRRGRPDAPAGRAPGRDARDPRPHRDPARRRQRGGRGLGRDPGGARAARSASCSPARTCRSSTAP